MNERVLFITQKISSNYSMVDTLGQEINNLHVAKETTEGDVKEVLGNVVEILEETISGLNNEAVALTKELLTILDEERKAPGDPVEGAEND